MIGYNLEKLNINLKKDYFIYLKQIYKITQKNNKIKYFIIIILNKDFIKPIINKFTILNIKNFINIIFKVIKITIV